MKAKLILTALVFMASAGILSAQTPKTDNKTNEAKKTCYVDANNNGVCDNYENKTCTTGNGKGLRNGTGNGNGQCRANQNGNRRGNCNGTGNGTGKQDGTGRGPNYVDANNNGVCDHSEK